jgi:hypothetical protein
MRKSFMLLILPLLFACASNKIKLTQVGKFQSSVRAEQLVDHREPLRSEKETINTTASSEEVSSQRSSEHQNHLNGPDESSIEHKSSKGFGVQNEEQKPLLDEETAEQTFSAKQNKGSAKVYTNELLIALGGVMALFLFLSLKINPDRAKRVSYWAKENPKKTMWMINGIKMITGVGGLYIGKMFYENDIAFSNTSTYALLGIFGAAAIAYPLKSAKRNFIKHTYLKRKVIDGLLALSGFLLMISLGNQVASDENVAPVITTVFEKTDQLFSQEHHGANDQMTSYTSDEIDEISTEATDEEKKSGKNAGKIIGQILLTLLAVALFIGLLYILAILSCSLSCNGQEALAVVVLLGGLAVCVGLLILAISAIWKKL